MLVAYEKQSHWPLLCNVSSNGVVIVPFVPTLTGFVTFVVQQLNK